MMTQRMLEVASTGLDLGGIAERMFMIMLQDFMDPWTFNQKNLMKCCKAFLLPDGKQIPFCAYNSVGYREQARVQLAQRERERHRARRAGRPYDPPPLTFDFEQPVRPLGRRGRVVDEPATGGGNGHAGHVGNGRGEA